MKNWQNSQGFGEQGTLVNSDRKSPLGLFLSFEGGEGAGKSTQIHALKRKLEAHCAGSRNIKLSWEPGGTALGERIRSVLLDPSVKGFSSKAELLLYAAARAQHVEELIRPALLRGEIVLCDRYWDASRAYQGWGRSFGFSLIDQVNMWATDGLMPQKTFLFDIDPKVGLRRVAERTQGRLDRLEQEALKFHESVREAYLEIASRDAKRFVVLDATKEEGQIEKEIWLAVEPLL